MSYQNSTKAELISLIIQLKEKYEQEIGTYKNTIQELQNSLQSTIKQFHDQKQNFDTQILKLQYQQKQSSSLNQGSNDSISKIQKMRSSILSLKKQNENMQKRINQLEKDARPSDNVCIQQLQNDLAEKLKLLSQKGEEINQLQLKIKEQENEQEQLQNKFQRQLKRQKEYFQDQVEEAKISREISNQVIQTTEQSTEFLSIYQIKKTFEGLYKDLLKIVTTAPSQVQGEQNQIGGIRKVNSLGDTKKDATSIIFTIKAEKFSAFERKYNNVLVQISEILDSSTVQQQSRK